MTNSTPDIARVAGGLTDDEWKARFKYRFEKRLGLRCTPEYLESARSVNPDDDDPEEAANSEIALWGDEA